MLVFPTIMDLNILAMETSRLSGGAKEKIPIDSTARPLSSVVQTKVDLVSEVRHILCSLGLVFHGHFMGYMSTILMGTRSVFIPPADGDLFG